VLALNLTSTRNALASNLLCHVMSYTFGREPSISKNLVSAGMLEKFVWNSQLGNSCVDPRSSKVLANPCADSTDLDAIFNRDDDSMITSMFKHRMGNRHNPTGVNHGATDALRFEQMRSLHGNTRHWANAEKQNVSGDSL
jgi:hypothetical protein